MLYIFILESIGTSELILIALVALVIFGPRKLPEFARMLGKARNEFRRTTDDFRQTWEREVDFETVERQVEAEPAASNTISQNSISDTEISVKNKIVSPEIKELSQADFQNAFVEKSETTSKQIENSSSDKRDWL